MMRTGLSTIDANRLAGKVADRPEVSTRFLLGGGQPVQAAAVAREYRRPEAASPEVPLKSFRVNPVFRASGWWHDCGVPETVLLVDDHSGFRAAARQLLETSGFEVVGEAV